MKRSLPENHWEYAENPEYRLARNALCNVMSDKIRDEIGNIDDDFFPLVVPLKASRIECLIAGRELWEEIHGIMKIKVHGYVRGGNRSPENPAEELFGFSDETETAALLDRVTTDDRIALTTYAYSLRRDCLRWNRDQLKKKGLRSPKLNERIFWMENLYNRQVNLMLKGMN